MNSKTTTIVVAVIAALAFGVAGFALGRTTDHGPMGMSNQQSMPGHDMGRMMGAGNTQWNGTMMSMGDMPGMQMQGSGAMTMSDQAFLAMMIPHHQMAVDMARIQLERGKDPQTRELAARVIKDQEGEIAQMQSWYRDWFAGDPPSMPMSGAMAMMGMNMDMDELRTTSKPDHTFLRMMVPHHAGAILMAEMTLAGSPRAEVQGLARDIVAAQSAEIGDMQAMRVRLAPPKG